jgi:hypothetical protein
VFAISQAALRYALPRGVQVLTEPNKFGSLLDPGIYRDIEISDMYLVEDVLDDMLVPPLDVPAFQATPMNKVAFKTAYESLCSPTGKNIFKSERKSDFESGNYKATITKVRKAAEYPVAEAQFKQMMGTEGARMSINTKKQCTSFDVWIQIALVLHYMRHWTIIQVGSSTRSSKMILITVATKYFEIKRIYY